MSSRREGQRTQPQRRAQTRGALLDATVACLDELGFAATTTTEVSRRAGVSTGALLHHFPTKAELLAAAVEHVLMQRQSQFADAMAAVPPGPERLEAAIDLLWSAYSGPTFLAWLELWVAARTDPELAAVVVAVDQRFVATAEAQFLALFPGLPAPPGALAFTFALMDGLALQGLVPYRDDAARSIETLKSLTRLVLGSAPEPEDAR